MQTLRAGCSKVEPKIFAPPQTPFPGARDGQYIISWRWSLPLPTNPVWWGSIHAISSYCGNRHTHTARLPARHRQGWLQYTAPQLSAQCIYSYLHGLQLTELIHLSMQSHQQCSWQRRLTVSIPTQKAETLPSDPRSICTGPAATRPRHWRA